ncbi:MAG: hypothetical protein CMK32_09005 [Porticoccaceae bacterium]|nr:hypothetical protein [Porticoccaceae bacterium]
MLETIEKQSLEVLATVIALLPSLAGAVLVVIAGWILARILRLIVGRIIHSVNHLLDRRLNLSALSFAHISPTAERLVGILVFWATLLIALTIAVRLVGFVGVAQWLDRLVIYLPSLVAAGILIVAGFLVGTIARELIIRNIELPQAPALARLTQASFVAVGVVLGLSQAGIDVTFVIILFAIALAAVLGGFGLAFGLGARTLVENLIAVRHLRQVVDIGQRVAVAGTEGRVLEFTATAMVLETIAGRHLVPASLCLNETLQLLTGAPDDE